MAPVYSRFTSVKCLVSSLRNEYFFWHWTHTPGLRENETSMILIQQRWTNTQYIHITCINKIKRITYIYILYIYIYIIIYIYIYLNNYKYIYPIHIRSISDPYPIHPALLSMPHLIREGSPAVSIKKPPLGGVSTPWVTCRSDKIRGQDLYRSRHLWHFSLVSSCRLVNWAVISTDEKTLC